MTCWTWTWTWKPTWASTRSSRPRCSPPSASGSAIPRDENLKLRDFPTLAHVIGFVRDRAPCRRTGAPRPWRTAAPAARNACACRPRRSRRRRPRPPAGRRRAADRIDGGRSWQIVERLTGYPRDLLDLDLDLEADLGVDTVKQAEVFAAVREQFDIPRDENLKLRDFPTLAHVIGFVRDRAPCRNRPAPRHPRPRPHRAASGRSRRASRWPRRPQTVRDRITTAVLDIIERLTGYPRDLLDLDLDLEADLGVDTVKQAEVFAAVREQFGIPRDENLKLRDFPTLAHVIGFVRDRAPGAATARGQPAHRLRTAAAAHSRDHGGRRR